VAVGTGGQGGAGYIGVGTSTIQPGTPISGTYTHKVFGIEEICTIVKNEKGDYTVSGDIDLLREYFEAKPKFWLRLLALKAEEEHGKTTK